MNTVNLRSFFKHLNTLYTHQNNSASSDAAGIYSVMLVSNNSKL